MLFYCVLLAELSYSTFGNPWFGRLGHVFFCLRFEFTFTILLVLFMKWLSHHRLKIRFQLRRLFFFCESPELAFIFQQIILIFVVSYSLSPMSGSSEMVLSKLRHARLEQRFGNLNGSAKSVDSWIVLLTHWCICELFCFLSPLALLVHVVSRTHLTPFLHAASCSLSLCEHAPASDCSIPHLNFKSQLPSLQNGVQHVIFIVGFGGRCHRSLNSTMK